MTPSVFLAFEGAEKLWEKFGPGHHAEPSVVVVGGPDEKVMIRGAIRTDLILSAEIMVIALNEVASEPLLSRAAFLAMLAESEAV